MWKEVWEAGDGFYRTESDRWAIARYVVGSVRLATWQTKLEDRGWTTLGSQGQLVPHPLARMSAQIERELLALEDRLGLDPEARLRLGLGTATKKSRLDQFMAG